MLDWLLQKLGRKPRPKRIDSSSIPSVFTNDTSAAVWVPPHRNHAAHSSDHTHHHQSDHNHDAGAHDVGGHDGGASH